MLRGPNMENEANRLGSHSYDYVVLNYHFHSKFSDMKCSNDT